MKAHESVEAAGRRAFEDGKPRTAQPYRDLRTPRGNVTGARGYIRAWLRGWDAAAAAKGAA